MKYKKQIIISLIVTGVSFIIFFILNWQHQKGTGVYVNKYGAITQAVAVPNIFMTLTFWIGLISLLIVIIFLILSFIKKGE